MAELVAAFPVGAFIDPQNGNSPIDADEVRANDDALRAGYNSHDAAATIHFQGSVVASRPGAGVVGRKWFASDTKQIFRDNGTSWDEIDYLNLTNGGTVAGAVIFSGGLTSTASGTAATFSSSAAGARTVRLTSSSASNGAHLTLENSSATSGFRNWGFASNFNAAAALEFRVSTALGGDPIAAGQTVLKLENNGVTTVANDLVVGPAAGISTQGKIAFHSTDGLQLLARTGSVYDFTVATPVGGYVMRVPTGTANVQFVGLAQFGGATSSFPALKSVAAELRVRLADDSAFANFSAADVSVAAGSSVRLGGQSRMTAQAGTSVSTTPTAITSTTGNGGLLVLVRGFDGTNTFADLVFSGASFTVLSTGTGGHAARTYSVSGGALRVALASGTSTVDTTYIQVF